MARIPNAAGLFPAFKDAPWLTKDGKTYGIPMIWGDEPCVYDPKKWDAMPAKYTDFADPKYKGELVLLDDPFGNIWLFAKSLGMPGAEPADRGAARAGDRRDADDQAQCRHDRRLASPTWPTCWCAATPRSASAAGPIRR